MCEHNYTQEEVESTSLTDKVAARDGYKNRIFCGQGNRDLVYKDPFDKTQGCERTTNQKPSP